MAKALADYLRTARFPDSSGGTQFSEVFDEWPGAEDRFVNTAACVLPRGAMTYADARLTPTLIPGTWEREGEPGFGLYAMADAECDFEVQVRAASPKERADIVAGFETMFVEDGVLMNYLQGRRNGRLITLDAYFGLPARFSLQQMTIDDDGDAAMRNRREATFVVRAQAKHVKVGPVQPFTLRIVETVDGEPAQ